MLTRGIPVNASMRRTPEPTALSLKNGDKTDFTRVSNMGTAAQFQRPGFVIFVDHPWKPREPLRRIFHQTEPVRRVQSHHQLP